MEELVVKLLEEGSYDLDDDNFRDTPRRVVSWLKEFCRSKEEAIRKAEEVLSASFTSGYGGIVLVQGVRVFSLCPHHLLPVEMDVGFAYIPSGKVVGVSKIPRFLKELGKALWLQEDYTQKALQVFEKVLSPRGVMIVVKGVHFCMRMRGVKEENAVMQTMAISGVFEEEKVKVEVLHRLNLLS